LLNTVNLNVFKTNLKLFKQEPFKIYVGNPFYRYLERHWSEIERVKGKHRIVVKVIITDEYVIY